MFLGIGGWSEDVSSVASPADPSNCSTVSHTHYENVRFDDIWEKI